MLDNYLKIAIRKAINDKAYSLINLVGLAIGLASFLYISRYVGFEQNVDRFHTNFDHIYRLHTHLKWNEMDEIFPQTAPAVGTAISDNFAEAEFVTRIHPLPGKRMVKVGNDIYQESGILSVDSNFLKVFSFEIQSGNPDKLFDKPDRVVLTESWSKQFFGDRKGLNQTLEIDGKLFVVSGIIQDPPADSHLQYSILMSNLSDRELKYFEWSWVWCNLVTYIKLHPETLPENLEAKFPGLVRENAGYAIERITGKSIDRFFKNGNSLGYQLEPLADVYYSGYNPIGTSGSRTFVLVFGIVAFTILFLACINYTNLTTARSMNRAKEIGLRKVAGTSKNQLYLQFLIESILFSFVASILAIFIYESLNSIINSIYSIQWNLSLTHNVNYLWFILVVSFAVGIFSGIYPALYLSSFKPAGALKGLYQKGQTKSPMRNWLVGFQFVISFCIIIFTVAVNSQIRYLKNRDLGFDKENLIVINNINLLKSRNAFKEEVNKNSAVISSTLSSNIPSLNAHGELFRRMNGKQEDFIMTLIDADHDFVNTFSLNINKGENYTSNDLISQSPGVVINNKAKEILAYEDAIGQTIMGLDDGRTLRISGIIDDFDYFLSQVELRPIIIRPYIDREPENSINHLTVKISTGDLSNTIGNLEEIWKAQKPEIPFQYHFYDDIFKDMYIRQIRLGSLLTLFSGLAITIAISGLVGLISFHTKQLTKSIGIRKVFGAKTFTILALITRDFLRLFVLAFVIAIPVVNYAIKDWLETFVNKMDLSIWLFLMPGLGVIITALLTIWIQSYKSAIANPVDAMRNE
ncbi:MAG: ABC transporter permease [Cytophagales bacterium]|nr:ABC transporter permease [Cytophagales bacterium]